MGVKELLSEKKEKIRNLDIEERKLIIWGMGHVAMLYENAFKTEKIGIYAYTGKNVISSTGHYNGYPVICPQDILKIDDPLIIICVKNQAYIREIEEQIKNLDANIDYLTVDEFFFGENADIIMKNFSLLEDDESKRVYEQLIERRISNDMRMYDLFEEHQYFALPEFRTDDIGEVFVDMGGFVGDTLERYLFMKFGTFKKYYVFEPDERNYSALLKRIRRLNEEWNLDSDKIIPVFAGVGRENSIQFFEEMQQGNYGSHFTEKNSGTERKIVALDSFFKDTEVSFLKADIESYEYDMLLGGIEILKRDRPRLAISIYHNASDMYRILSWLADLNLGYKFYIRHHSVRDTETVLYAVCD